MREIMADAVKRKKRKKKHGTAPWRQTKRALLILFFLTFVAIVTPVWHVVRAQGKTSESPKNTVTDPVPRKDTAESVTPQPGTADKRAESGPLLTDNAADRTQSTQASSTPVQYTEPVPLTTLPSAEENPAAWYEYGAGAQDTNSITILGCGDNLMHSQLYENAFNGETYDFSPYYENVKAFVGSADIATINQETPMATDLYEPSTYPSFNTPKQIGDAILDTGFDVINLGNNHIYDKGTAGALATLEYFAERNIPTVGIYTSMEDAGDIRVVEKNGIKVAFVSFVEFTNSDADEEGTDIIWLEDTEGMKDQIHAARQAADIVVAHVHWGIEGTTELTELQTSMAQFMVDEGVDIVFGNHPHWLQELTVLTRESDGTRCPVIYSMGNFLSGMDRREELITGFLTVEVSRDANGKVIPVKMGFLPLVIHFSNLEKTDLRIYPLCRYSEEMAAANAVNVIRDDDTFDLDLIQNVVDTSIPKEYQNQMVSIY